MNTILTIEKNRLTVQSQKIHFDLPSPHPDRVMKEHDLFYVVEGGWNLRLNGKDYPVKKDDAVFLPAGYRHFSNDLCPPGTTTLFVHTPPLPCDRSQEGHSPVGETEVELPTVISCESFPQIKRMFEDIIFSFWSPLDINRKRAAPTLTLLLCELSRISDQSKNTTRLLIDEVLELMERKNERMFTIEELTNTVGVSAKTLTSWFKKTTGKTVHQYQVETKLSKAHSTILNNPAITFRELALSLGFYDEFHFSRLFKQKYGCSPMELKKAARKNYR